jgi:hypothetical protein
VVRKQMARVVEGHWSPARAPPSSPACRPQKVLYTHSLFYSMRDGLQTPHSPPEPHPYSCFWKILSSSIKLLRSGQSRWFYKVETKPSGGPIAVEPVLGKVALVLCKPMDMESPTAGVATCNCVSHGQVLRTVIPQEVIVDALDIKLAPRARFFPAFPSSTLHAQW